MFLHSYFKSAKRKRLRNPMTHGTVSSGDTLFTFIHFLGGAFIALFGPVNMVAQTWAILAFSDLVIGTLIALLNKQASTDKFRSGIIRKAIDFLLIVVITWGGIFVQVPGLRNWFIGALVVKELFSIGENTMRLHHGNNQYQGREVGEFDILAWNEEDGRYLYVEVKTNGADLTYAEDQLERSDGFFPELDQISQTYLER